MEIIFNKENKIDVSKKLKYSLLMADIGRLLVIGKVRKNVKIWKMIYVIKRDRNCEYKKDK